MRQRRLLPAGSYHQSCPEWLVHPPVAVHLDEILGAVELGLGASEDTVRTADGEHGAGSGSGGAALSARMALISSYAHCAITSIFQRNVACQAIAFGPTHPSLRSRTVTRRGASRSREKTNA